VPDEECGVRITRILLCTRSGYTYTINWSDLWISSSDIRSLNVLKGAVHFILNCPEFCPPMNTFMQYILCGELILLVTYRSRYVHANDRSFFKYPGLHFLMNRKRNPG